MPNNSPSPQYLAGKFASDYLFSNYPTEHPQAPPRRRQRLGAPGPQVLHPLLLPEQHLLLRGRGRGAGPLDDAAHLAAEAGGPDEALPPGVPGGQGLAGAPPGAGDGAGGAAVPTRRGSPQPAAAATTTRAFSWSHSGAAVKQSSTQQWLHHACPHQVISDIHGTYKYLTFPK